MQIHLHGINSNQINFSSFTLKETVKPSTLYWHMLEIVIYLITEHNPISTELVFAQGSSWWNADSLLYEDGLFD